jgi:hypothetical protein
MMPVTPNSTDRASKAETAAEVLRRLAKRKTAPASQPSHLAGRIRGGPVRARPGRPRKG